MSDGRGLDPYRQEWKVRLGDGRADYVLVTGRLMPDGPALVFESADGSRQVFEPGQYRSATAIFHPDDPSPTAPLMRSFFLGDATLKDVQFSGRWLREQIDAEEATVNG